MECGGADERDADREAPLQRAQPPDAAEEDPHREAQVPALSHQRGASTIDCREISLYGECSGKPSYNVSCDMLGQIRYINWLVVILPLSASVLNCAVTGRKL